MLLVALLAAGCGDGRDLPETLPVTGTVVYKGEPLADAEIGFVPSAPDSGAHPARGRTDAAGKFTLKTYFGPTDDVAGATPGEYKVTVQKRDVPADPAELAKHFQLNPQMVPASLVPTKYESVDTTPLSATVAEDAANDFPLEMTD
jgi:hypothetical protein